MAEDMLKKKEKMLSLEIEKAKAEGEKDGLKAAADEYKKGVAAGAAIASGKPFRFCGESPMPPSSAAHSASSGSNYR